MNSACSDPAMAAFIMIFKNIMTVFQIIVPIILIVSAAISVGTIMMFPDDTDVKGPPGRPNRVVPRVILHKVIAAIVVFFIPYIVNLTVSLTVSVIDSSSSANGLLECC